MLLTKLTSNYVLGFDWFLTLFLLAEYAACVAIGGIYFNQCPAERMIPIFLIVVGARGLTAMCLKVLSCKFEQSQFIAFLYFILTLFALLWLIYGRTNLCVATVPPAIYSLCFCRFSLGIQKFSAIHER